MSAFPQMVWRPSGKDVLTEFAPRTVFQRATNSQALAAFGVTMPSFIPVDQVFLLRSLLLVADPGAAQVIQSMSVFITQNGGTVVQLVGGSNFPVTVAGHPSSLLWTGEIVLTNTEDLTGSGTFDLGVAANSLTLNVCGIIVPRGNWQR